MPALGYEVPRGGILVYSLPTGEYGSLCLSHSSTPRGWARSRVGPLAAAMEEINDSIILLLLHPGLIRSGGEPSHPEATASQLSTN